MYPSNNNDSQDTSELDAIKAQIHSTTNESLESTRRMLGMVAEAQDIGTNTMVMLDEQGEQLKKIESGLDNVHAGMTEAEKNLNELQKCCGLCVLPWNRMSNTHRPMSNSSTKYNSEKSSPVTTEPKLRMMGDEGMPKNGYITRITNDAREDEMDDNLQLVSSYLGNLKNMSLDMRDTIVTQSKTIDNIAEKSEAGIERVETANKQAKYIIKTR